MISLTCSNCKARLQMDDAFAGGACRCRYCGTIQTVPSHLKETNGQSGIKSKRGKPQAAKALIRQSPRADGSPAGNVGLDELAEAVSSSGALAGSGLRAGRLRAETIAPPVNPRRKMLAMIAGASAGVLLGVTILWMMLGGGSVATTTSQTTAPHSLANPTSTAANTNPHFCGVPIPERVVVYVLDRGSATSEFFGDLKEACYQSIESLGPDRKFQIVFWDNGTETAYPRAGPTFATATNLDLARRALEDINAHGQTDPSSAMMRAFQGNPGAIVLATGKAYELDDGFVRTVDSVRKDSAARIYTFALGSGESGTALKTIARRTGGQFRAVSAADLREYRE